jgi:hypothetical protein
MARKPTKKAAAPQRAPQTALATWFRKMAEQADKGLVTGFAAVITTDELVGPHTNIVDPVDSDKRMALAGSVGQLHHMLQATEHNTRMASLASRPAD